MQREGSLKYNLVAGRYHSDDASQRPLMMQLSLMRGFAHNLTLFGGLQSAAQYHNLSVGAEQGLGRSRALSLQLLNARAPAPAGSDRWPGLAAPVQQRF